jgi:hypothetical protein
MAWEVTRTVRVRLDVPDDRKSDLHATNTLFQHCANRTSEWAWRYPDDFFFLTAIDSILNHTSSRSKVLGESGPNFGTFSGRGLRSTGANNSNRFKRRCSSMSSTRINHLIDDVVQTQPEWP